MFRTLFTAVATIMIAGAAMAAPVIGKPAPAFTGTDAISGKPVSLADLKGKTVVLEWTNPDCPFVKKFYSGKMQELQADAKKDGVVWVSINSSAAGKEGNLDAKSAKEFIDRTDSNTAHYLLDADGTIGHAYGAKTTPHMFVIDKTGTLVYMGGIDDKPTADIEDIKSANNYVTAALASLKKGEPVKTSSSKPYGCFVKYQ